VHLGESMLAMGAVVVFTMGALRLNTMRLDSQSRMLEAEYYTTAVGLAQSYVEQAQGLGFDEAVAAGVSPAAMHSGVTHPVALGPEAGEIHPGEYDDLDDLHGHSRVLVTPRGRYSVNLAVSYADSATLAPSASVTLLKWLTVSVSSPDCRDTVRVRYLYAFR